MAQEKEFILKRGALIQPVFGGKYYSSLTITDDVARTYLQRHPEDKHLFEKMGSLDAPVVAAAPVEPQAVEGSVVAAPVEETPVVKKTTKRKAKR